MNVIFQKLNIQIIFMVSDLKSCFWDKTSEESQLLKVMFRCHLLVVWQQGILESEAYHIYLSLHVVLVASGK